MVISSTEFQQNTGYYITLAEQGEEVIVERKKPTPLRYRIQIEPKKGQATKKKRMTKIVKHIQTLNMNFSGNDAVTYQRDMRS